jgi:hypothetical protein
MVRSRRWSALLFIPLFALLMGARQVPLTDPAPIAVPAGIALKDVGKSIKVALVGRQWLVSDDQPGHIAATLNLREHMAKIDVTYDEKAINLKYVDSKELLYEDKKGERLIHRNYLNWVQNLVTDISRNLQLSAP